MQEFVVRFSTESTYNNSDMAEMKDAMIDVLIDLDDEIDGDTIVFEKYSAPKVAKTQAATSEIDEEKIVANWIDNTSVEDVLKAILASYDRS